MRTALLLALTLSLSSPSANACSNTFRAIGEFAAGLKDALNYTVGNAEQCWTDANGASTVTCEEVEAADRVAFSSHYRYEFDQALSIAQNSAKGFRSCNPISAKDILEDLTLSDLARMVDDSLGCNLPFMNQLMRQPNSPRAKEFSQRAFQAYSDNFDRLHDLITQRDRLQSTDSIGHSSCQMIGTRESMSLPASCQRYISSTGQATRDNINQLNTKIHAIEAQIPFATDQSVRDKIENLVRAGTKSQAGFAANYNAQLGRMTADLNRFKAELTSAKSSSGQQYFMSASLRARLMKMPIYNDLIKSKTGLSPKLQGVLTCLHDRRELGESRVNGGVMAAGALSIVLTGGASLTGVALAGGARAALVATDLALGAVGTVQSVDAIYNSCYHDTTAYPRGGTCNAEQSFAFIMQKTSTATCVKDVLSGVAPVVMAAASTTVRAVTEARAVARELRESETIADIVVTAPRARTVENQVVARARRLTKEERGSIPPCSIVSSPWSLVIPPAWASPCTAEQKQSLLSRARALLARKPAGWSGPIPANPQAEIWRLRQAGDSARAASLETAVQNSLREGRVTASERIFTGDSGAQLITFEDGTKGVFKPLYGNGKPIGNNEVVVSAIDRELGTNLVPLTVRRNINGTEGTVQLFVESQPGVKFDWNPPQLAWFDELIANADRNPGNTLRGVDGRMVAIDHGNTMNETGRGYLTDAIRSEHDGFNPREVQMQYIGDRLPSRAMAAKLESVPEARWRTILSPTMNERQIQAFLKRRDQLIRDFQTVRERYGDSIFRN